MDEDVKIINELRNEIRELQWRLTAIEKEQRKIREDILSGEPMERMKKRILNHPPEKMDDVKKKIDKQIQIKI